MITSSNHLSRNFFEKKPHAIAPLGIRLNQRVCDIGINMKHIAIQRQPSIPVWCLKSGIFNFDLQILGKKSDVPPHEYISKYNEFISRHENYTRFYTDGSKYDTKVAAAAVCENSIMARRLPDNSTIFSAEIHAINLALNMMKNRRGHMFMIFSDSLSSLIALQNRQWSNSLVLETLEKIHDLIAHGISVVLVWLPSHVGIKGNTDADTAAKAALAAPPDNISVPHSDFRHHIHEYFKSKWQSIWDSQIDNKLHKIKPNIGITYFGNQLDRRKEQVLHRLRIGHTYLTRAFLLRRESKPLCATFNCQLSVEHILLSCRDYDNIRSLYFNVSTLDELFEKTSSLQIVDFIKDIGLYKKI